MRTWLCKYSKGNETHKQDINETITWNKTRTLKLQRKKAST